MVNNFLGRCSVALLTFISEMLFLVCFVDDPAIFLDHAFCVIGKCSGFDIMIMNLFFRLCISHTNGEFSVFCCAALIVFFTCAALCV